MRAEGVKSPLANVVLSCVFYLASGPTLILVNKTLLTQSGFSYPIALSSLGQLSSFVICFTLIHVFGFVESSSKVSMSFWLTKILPIGLCQALTLNLGLRAYMFLSVAFIQMMKAFSPATAMLASLMVGKSISREQIIAVFVICTGTLIAAFGEVHLDMTGVFYLAVAEVAECTRLVMTQTLLQDMNFSVVESLSVIAPASFFWLIIGSLIFESAEMRLNNATGIIVQYWHLFALAMTVGFFVNVSGYWVIKSTNGVTLKVLGTARNGGLITFCAFFLGEVITTREVLGYMISIMAFLVYSFLQVKNIRDVAAKVPEEEIKEKEKELSGEAPPESEIKQEV
eukprot:m.21995 g.21995  ORF g.21995 m.21995 type:complete len:341 (+) comp7309_c0_seq1:253-1275(+)